MSATAPARSGMLRHNLRLALPALLLGAMIALVSVWGWRSATSASFGGLVGSRAARTPPASPAGPNQPVWGSNVKVTVPFQRTLDQLPQSGPYMLRVTELEMEPGTKIFEHRQIGVGAHIVLRGSITIEDLDAGQTSTYRAGEVYYEGMEPLHRAENTGREPNRILMVDLLPASRGFDGTQQFTERGRHNSGELRSGPYVQVPLNDLPSAPLMLRVSEMAFGPKAKTVEHTRSGPTIFFVQEGTATTRKDWDNSMATYGTNGYFFETGREPFILENKPATPARFIAIELLSAALGDAPSTVPTGRGANDSSD